MALNVCSHRTTSATGQRDGYAIILAPPAESVLSRRPVDGGGGGNAEESLGAQSDETEGPGCIDAGEKGGKRGVMGGQTYACIEIEDSIA